MQGDETPTDDQLERALSSSDAPPIRREWNTAGEWRRLRTRIAADEATSAHDALSNRKAASG